MRLCITKSTGSVGIYLFSSVYLKFLGSKSTLMCFLCIVAKFSTLFHVKICQIYSKLPFWVNPVQTKLSKIADLRYGQMPRDSSGWAQPHIVQVNSVRQTSLNSFYSSNFSLMNVTSQFSPVILEV